MTGPSLSEFIAALFLAKSKPPELPLREYITAVRSCVKTGHRPQYLDGARYVDTLALWKDSHQRLQGELQEHIAKIFALERQLDTARGSDSQTAQKAALKRSAVDPVPDSVSKRAKRRRTNAPKSTSPVLNPSSAPFAWSHDGDGPEYTDKSLPHDLATGLSNAIYALQTSLAQRSAAISSTAGMISFVLMVIRRNVLPTEAATKSPAKLATSLSLQQENHQSSSPTVDGSDMFPSSSPTQPDDGINGFPKPMTVAPQESSSGGRDYSISENWFDASTRSIVFPTLFAAIEQLGHRDDGISSQLVHSTVKLLKDLLHQVCDLAAANSTEPLRDATRIHNGRRSCRGAKLTELQVQEQPPAIGIMRICNVIAGALQCLQKGRRTDEAIKEGFMFFLLRKIGEILKAFVFGENDETWDSTLGQEVITVSTVSTAAAQTRQKNRTIKERQAPYLLWLLERSLTRFTIDTDSGSRTSDGGQARPRSPTNRRQGIFSEKVKAQLQDTILKEVLGDRICEFEASLQQCQDPSVPIKPWSDVKTRDIADLFKAEVWRLIGWDSLKGYLERDISRSR